MLQSVHQQIKVLAQANLPGNIWTAPATFATWAFENATNEVTDDDIMAQLTQLDASIQASK